MTESSEDFIQAMLSDGVVPKQMEQRVNRSASGMDEEQRQARQEAAALAEEEDGLSLKPQPWLHPLDPIQWCKDGVQEGVYRNLRLGNYSADSRLDLAGLRPAQAREELVNTVKESVRLGIRTVLVHYGRSSQRESRANQLKTYLNLWLPRIDSVMAFHCAQPQHGGYAAIYVLLKKNDKARQANLEKHLKRGS